MERKETLPHHAASAPDDRAIPPSALLLGGAGVLPFLILTLGSLLRVEERLGLPPGAARSALLTYGVVIVSFLGGVRWGVGLLHRESKRATALFAMSVQAPLLAWAALFIPRPFDFVVVIGCLLVLGYSDIKLAANGTTPRWYGTLRAILTAAVVAIMIVALAMLPLAEVP